MTSVKWGTYARIVYLTIEPWKDNEVPKDNFIRPKFMQCVFIHILD